MTTSFLCRIPLVLLFLFFGSSLYSQDPPKNESKEQTEQSGFTSREPLRRGARIYVASIQNGFETYVTAGMEKKKVPLVVVADRSKADYELTGVSDTDKAGWAKMLFIGSQQTNESASIKIVNLRTSNVVFAYSVNKTNSARGKQSAGEAVAKHIKQKIEESDR